jgi:hypothetical protein
MKLPADYNQLTWQERREARRLYAERQQGLCAHCGMSLEDDPIRDKPINMKLFPSNFFQYPVHLHHCHDTDLTIGVVHAYCNAVLWQYHGK